MSNKSGRPRPVVLVVLDGWGHRTERDGNAIEMAQTPTWHRLWANHPRTLLEASGPRVGLPEGQMGNSEVGHLNLGAGRVVSQDLVRIDASIADGSFFDLPPLRSLGVHLHGTGGTLHLLALLGAGGVHAIDRHLRAAVELAVRLDVPRIAVHGFLDGRDSPPHSGEEVVRALVLDLQRIAGPRAVLASLSGRYFAMDRDQRWDRTSQAYDALVYGSGRAATDPVAAVIAAYERGESDEFVTPITLHEGETPRACIRDGDGVFCVNYRSDRMRQIVEALAGAGFDGFETGRRPVLHLVTMTQYDARFPYPQAFPPTSLAGILAEVLADRDLTQFRTAETEKYAHVTYFFNGGLETPYRHEERCLVPSQQVATYDLAPEMSASGITDALCGALDRGDHDFLLCNFANADMVGHTGMVPAVIRAVETLDGCLDRVIRATDAAGARLLITADHGNCEMMFDPSTGGPHTAHTTNPVPFVAVGTGAGTLRRGGALCDVAPTVLNLLGVDQPVDMSGRALNLL